MSALGELRLVLLTAIGFGVLASLLGSVAVDVLRRRIRTWAPSSRRWALVLAGVTPLLSAAVAFGAAMLPAVRGYVEPGADHCLHHNDDHAHLCFLHWPAHVGGLFGWSLVVGLFGWLTLRLVTALASMHHTRRLLTTLRQQASPEADGRTWTVPADRPLGVTLGLLRPWILLSSGLRARVSSDTLRVIVAHEEAHVRTRDALLQLLVRGASFVLPPPVRRRLLEELVLATEQAADEHAAHTVGDRMQVAEAILAVERLKVPSPALPLLSVSFAPQHVTQRVESLLEEPLPAHPAAPIAMILLLGGVLLLAANDPIHHLTESILGWLSP